jgi:O-acetyl-ADP-ribose deacetylase (regulator of RNase III)
MGRIEPSHAPLAQQSHRKEQRAKHARLTINKTIPNLLKTNYRARQGIEKAELIVDPPAVQVMGVNSKQEVPKPDNGSKSTSGSKKKRGKKSRDLDQDAKEEELVQVPSAKKSKLEEHGPLIYKIQVSDTLQAAQILNNLLPKKPKIPNQNVALLNMASPLRPGGGVLNGATSQEESLCTRTTLLPTLRDEWYRLPEIGAAWSPDVCVFRVPKVEGGDQELDRRDRFYVDVISAGMMRFPEVVEKSIQALKAEDGTENIEEVGETENIYANDRDRETALKKIIALMRILQSKGTERVVLGAWGCGAYGNPVGEIVTLWKKVLFGKSRRRKGKDPESPGSEWKPLKEIVFAIKDRKMAEEFAEAWGNDIKIEHGAIRERASTVGGNEVEERHLKELREKIWVLESQLEQVKTPLLRQGLENALASLQAQLEEAGGSSSIIADMSDEDAIPAAESSDDGEEDYEGEEEMDDEDIEKHQV